MTKSLAYISIYLGFFGWLFGSDKKEKQDQTSSVQENSSMTEESLEETSPVEEAQIEAPELFPNGLPLKNAKIPPEVGHPSAQNCGTCHTSIYSQWKNDGHGKNEVIKHFEGISIKKKGSPLKTVLYVKTVIFLSKNSTATYFLDLQNKILKGLNI